jgi:thiamine-phosphate pyrophosphorylase
MKMLLIITNPKPVPGETLIWQELLAAGAGAVLLRRPQWQEADYARALEQTDPDCYPHILIAQQAGLCRRFGLMGLHFSENARRAATAEELSGYKQQGCKLSTSLHFKESTQPDHSSPYSQQPALPGTTAPWRLLLLSPVFNSLSKPEYKTRLPAGFRLSKGDCSAQVLALGGVDHTNTALVREMGFDGAAMLGAIWKEPAKAVENFYRIQRIWNGNDHT